MNKITILIFSLLVLILMAIFVPYFAPHNPYAISLAHKFAPISFEHFLGTDHLGRDVFSRLLYGLQISLASVLFVSASLVCISLLVGSIAGYKGGLIDNIFMRICDAFLTLPTFILALFFMGILGTGLTNVLLTIIITHFAWYSRFVRSVVLEVKTRPYVLAAKSLGISDFVIIFRHILPTVFVQIVVLATLDFGHMILHIAGLSFLGLGIQAPTAEWGVMINDAMPYIRENPALMLYPGFCIFLIVALFNGFGEWVRDVFDTNYNHDFSDLRAKKEKEIKKVQKNVRENNDGEQNSNEKNIKNKNILVRVKNLELQSLLERNTQKDKKTGISKGIIPFDGEFERQSLSNQNNPLAKDYERQSLSNQNNPILKNISLDIYAGEVLVILGESGSGKTLLSLAMLDLLPSSVYKTGGEISFPKVRVEEKEQDLDITEINEYASKENENKKNMDISRLRGTYISMIMQSPATYFDQVHTIRQFFVDTLKSHKKFRNIEIDDAYLTQALQEVGIAEKDALRVLNSYPFALSGGFLQRVIIALNFALDPKILIADEIHSDLDVFGQEEILQVLLNRYEKNTRNAEKNGQTDAINLQDSTENTQQMRHQNNTQKSLIFITHDIGFATKIADRIVVMREGSIVDSFQVEEVHTTQRHVYTKELLRAHANLEKNTWGKKSDFFGGNDFPQAPSSLVSSEKICLSEEKSMGFFSPTNILLECRHISKKYAQGSWLSFSPREEKIVLKDVNFTMQEGRSVGLFGRNGIGKSTLIRLMLGLEKPSSGQIFFAGNDVHTSQDVQSLRRMFAMQVVFQNPAQSMNGRFSAFDVISEGLVNYMRHNKKRHAEEKSHTYKENASHLNYHAHFQPSYDNSHGTSVYSGQSHTHDKDGLHVENVFSFKNHREFLRHHVGKYMEDVGLRAQDMDKNIQHFSGGEQQRLCIARALCMCPKLLLLDEALANLDMCVQEQIIELLDHLKSSHHVSLFTVSHDNRVLLKLSDDIIVLENGYIKNKLER